MNEQTALGVQNSYFCLKLRKNYDLRFAINNWKHTYDIGSELFKFKLSF